jgi:hypothetical protein
MVQNVLVRRSQKVDIKGNLSEAMQLDISVIQGSILGPTFFLSLLCHRPLLCFICGRYNLPFKRKKT